MKVERIPVEPAFRPVVITLETEEEAAHLWHRLNADVTISFSDYCRGKSNVSENSALDYEMWKILRDMYEPKRRTVNVR